MKTIEQRERLHDYIDIADDKVVQAIYSLLEDKLPAYYDLLDDAEILAELNERMQKLEDGSDPGLTLEQFKENIQRKKLEYINKRK